MAQYITSELHSLVFDLKFEEIQASRANNFKFKFQARLKICKPHNLKSLCQENWDTSQYTDALLPV